MNRRAFLDLRNLFDPKGCLRVIEEAIGRVPGMGQTSHDPVLLRFSRQAMATTFELVLPFGARQELADAILDAIDQLEDQMTVYRPASEVSRINQLARHGPMGVEPRLFGLLQEAARLTAETDGAFDISTGALIKAWGFYRRQGRVPTALERELVQDKVGMQHVVLNPEEMTVAFARPGLEINLGSIGKGYALDRAAELLKSDGNIRAALLHGGRSSVLAVGRQPGDRRGWPIGVRHPDDPERRLAVLSLRDRGLGTSAATYQHLEYNGRRLGHILDPRTGWPADGVKSASVTAPTAALADALATAFFILGPDWAREYCERHPEIGAVLLATDNSLPLVLGRARQEIETPACC